MPRYVRFEMLTDDEITGEVGIVANIHQRWENYIPTQPFGVGHDLLDHASNERGYYYQEVAALGSAAFRNNFGHHLRTLSVPYENSTAWDMVSSYRDNTELIDAPKHRLSKIETARLDKFLAGVRPEAITAFDSEFGHEEEFDNDYTNPFESLETWERICAWFKYGFARAKRRFKNDSWSMFALRETIESVVQREWDFLLGWADSGKQFTLALDYENGSAWILGT
jgi:hypothetical protein